MRKGPVGVVVGIVLGLSVAPPVAAEVATEVHRVGRSVVTLHLHPFLTDEERATLRVVATNPDALALFVTTRRGHSAIAVAPREGFLRKGQPVASAVALSQFRDADSARRSAQAECDSRRTGGSACVTVLEVSPAR